MITALINAADSLAHMTHEYKKGLSGDNLESSAELIRAAAEQEGDSTRKIIKTVWAENNLTYLDYNIAVKPEWLTRDHEICIRISVDIEQETWYALALVDCADGPIEDWGCRQFSADELRDESSPIMYMVNALNETYNKRLDEENGKENEVIKKAVEARKLMDKHVDAIKKIAKDMHVNLYIDLNLNGANLVYVVPDNVSTEEAEGDSIDMNTLPYLDFDAHEFNSDYDTFTRGE